MKIWDAVSSSLLGIKGPQGTPVFLEQSRYQVRRHMGKKSNEVYPSKHEVLGDSDGEKYKVRAGTRETGNCAGNRQRKGEECLWGRHLHRRTQNTIIKLGPIFPVMKSPCGANTACCLPILFQELCRLLCIHLILLKETIKSWQSLVHRPGTPCSGTCWRLRVPGEKMANAKLPFFSATQATHT